jgi:hypothetical protein
MQFMACYCAAFSSAKVRLAEKSAAMQCGVMENAMQASSLANFFQLPSSRGHPTVKLGAMWRGAM